MYHCGLVYLMTRYVERQLSRYRPSSLFIPNGFQEALLETQLLKNGDEPLWIGLLIDQVGRKATQ